MGVFLSFIVTVIILLIVIVVSPNGIFKTEEQQIVDQELYYNREDNLTIKKEKEINEMIDKVLKEYNITSKVLNFNNQMDSLENNPSSFDFDNLNFHSSIRTERDYNEFRKINDEKINNNIRNSLKSLYEKSKHDLIHVTPQFQNKIINNWNNLKRDFRLISFILNKNIDQVTDINITEVDNLVNNKTALKELFKPENLERIYNCTLDNNLVPAIYKNIFKYRSKRSGYLVTLITQIIGSSVGMGGILGVQYAIEADKVNKKNIQKKMIAKEKFYRPIFDNFSIDDLKTIESIQPYFKIHNYNNYWCHDFLIKFMMTPYSLFKNLNLNYIEEFYNLDDITSETIGRRLIIEKIIISGIFDMLIDIKNSSYKSNEDSYIYDRVLSDWKKEADEIYNKFIQVFYHSYQYVVSLSIINTMDKKFIGENNNVTDEKTIIRIKGLFPTVAEFFEYGENFSYSSFFNDDMKIKLYNYNNMFWDAVRKNISYKNDKYRHYYIRGICIYINQTPCNLADMNDKYIYKIFMDKYLDHNTRMKYTTTTTTTTPMSTTDFKPKILDRLKKLENLYGKKELPSISEIILTDEFQINNDTFIYENSNNNLVLFYILLWIFIFMGLIGMFIVFIVIVRRLKLCPSFFRKIQDNKLLKGDIDTSKSIIYESMIRNGESVKKFNQYSDFEDIYSTISENNDGAYKETTYTLLDKYHISSV